MKHKRNDPRGAAKSARRDTHITVFGDSIPKGLYLEGGKVARIEKNAVTLVSDQFGLDIENFSVYGQTLKRCFDKGYFQRWLQENQTRHKVPVISLGGNDSDYDWAGVAADPLAEHQPVTPLSEFEDLLDKLMRPEQHRPPSGMLQQRDLAQGGRTRLPLHRYPHSPVMAARLPLLPRRRRRSPQRKGACRDRRCGLRIHPRKLPLPRKSLRILTFDHPHFST